MVRLKGHIRAKKTERRIANGLQRKVRKYEIGRTQWKEVEVPSAIFGAENITYRKQDIRKLETLQHESKEHRR